MNKISKWLPHVWQRVFLYAILLVFASHMASFVVFHYGLENDMHMHVLDRLASSGAAALKGKSRETAKVLPDFFSHDSRSLWIERPDGELIVGEPEPGLSYAERKPLPVARAHGNVRYLETGDPAAPYLAAIPVSLLDCEAILYLYLEKMPPPPMPVIFTQGLIAVFLVGGTLGVWAAWRIARPLRRLRSEVLEIAGGNLGARVSVEGAEEISQVAEAVNSMARNLSNNIMEMRELIANISHEMRSPLARMSISITIIEEGVHALARRYGQSPPPAGDSAPPVIMDADGRPLAVKHVGRVNQEIEHMENLVGSCLLNSKLDLQPEMPRVETLDLSALCKSILPRYEELFQSKNLSFSRSVQDGLQVEGDAELLSTVLTNLLDNAVKYTDEGGLVELGLRREEGRVLLNLENSHKALEAAELPRLFEPFFKRRETAGNTAGAGLGLSLVRKIVKCHHGSVTAENGKTGLLFTVALPCIQSPAPEFVEWFFERHGRAASA